MNIPALALAEFTQRRAQAARKVAAGTLPRQQAERLLLPWLALAIRVGADVADLVPQLAQDLAQLDQATGARTLLADSLCPRPVVLQTVAAARDAMLARHDPSAPPEKTTRTRTLRQLADHLGCPPFIPSFATPERKAA